MDQEESENISLLNTNGQQNMYQQTAEQQQIPSASDLFHIEAGVFTAYSSISTGSSKR